MSTPPQPENQKNSPVGTDVSVLTGEFHVLWVLHVDQSAQGREVTVPVAGGVGVVRLGDRGAQTVDVVVAGADTVTLEVRDRVDVGEAGVVGRGGDQVVEDVFAWLMRRCSSTLMPVLLKQVFSMNRSG